MDNNLSNEDLSNYLSATDGISKPWLLAQLRLKKLQDQKGAMPAAEYAEALADIHQDLMKLGEWWVGREDEVF